MPESSLAPASCAATTPYHAVFVDTSLDTHFATAVSSSDIVSDLKKKILYEHAMCFPNIGQIKINALKVSRRGFSYHLSESMLVKSVFAGVNDDCWFVSVDASVVEEHNVHQHSLDPGCNKFLAHSVTDGHPNRLSNGDGLLLLHNEGQLLVKQNPIVTHQLGLDVGEGESLDKLKLACECNDHGKIISIDANNRLDPHMQEKCIQNVEQNEAQGTQTGGDETNTENMIGDFQCSTLLEGDLGRKRKRKSKIKQTDIVHETAFKETDASEHESGKILSQQDIRVPQSSLGGAVGIASHDVQIVNQNVADGPCSNSSSDPSKRTNTKMQSVNVLSEGADVHQEYGEPKNDKSKDNAVYTQDNMSLKGTPQSGNAPRKKRKIEKKNGDEGLSEGNGTLLSSCNKETSEGLTILLHSLGDKQKEKNAALDNLPSEALERGRLHSPAPTSGKRKMKKKSSSLYKQQVVAVPPLVKDDRGEEHDAVSVSGEHVRSIMDSEPCAVSLDENRCDPAQEVNRGPSSQGINTSTEDTSNVESRPDASDIEGHNDYQKHETSEINGVDVERELVNNISHKTLLLEKCETSTGNEINMKTKEVVTSKLLGSSETADPGKSTKKKKKSKKTRDISGEMSIVSAAEDGKGSALDLSSAEHQKAINVDQPKDNGNKDDSVTPKERKEVSEVNTTETSPLAIQTTDARKSTKKRKKSKNTWDLAAIEMTIQSGAKDGQGSALDVSSPEHQKAINFDQPKDNGNKDDSITLSKERKEVSEVNTTGTSPLAIDREIDDMIQNVVESVQQIGKNQVNDETLDGKSRKKAKKKRNADANELSELQKDSKDIGHGISLRSTGNRKEDVTLSNRLNSVTVESSQILAHKPGGNSELRGPEAVDDDNPSRSGHADEATSNIELSCGSDRINFKDYFVPSQHHRENVASREVLLDEATKAKGAESDMKAKKKNKKLDAHSQDSSADLQSSRRLNGELGIGGKPQAGNLNTKELHLSISNAELEQMHPPEKKLSKLAGSGVEAKPSSKSDKLNSVPEQARKSSVVKSFGVNTKPKSKKEAVNSSQPKKSIIGTSGTIFKDDNYNNWPSAEEFDDSDASTRTASDNSSSSDYSEGESNGNLHTLQNGSDSVKRKEDSEKNITKPFSSGMSLDAILRSSSRYKKAKLTAAQMQLEDTESQPVDFVPDSQANP